MRLGIALALLALPLPAFAQIAPQDDAIVVQGRLEKLSHWREAETDHVISNRKPVDKRIVAEVRGKAA